MLEKDITNLILRFLKTVPNCFCWKEHGGLYGTSGIPDIVACINGRFYAFEVKTEAGKVTKLQRATIKKIQAAGGTAVVVRTVDEVRAVLKQSGLALRNEQ
ncbi:VRR-NUC domain-containing protein [Peptoclostridium acidaminophilum]|uniref:VRR-NUC domain-containing protein n=1 Tax=Peptoclostridium acidaminophilum TaxID=1731 RepID=UPI00046C8E7E|nr:VRR-NUC domain-containing protein [Peptoclostridium acidaminophilum]